MKASNIERRFSAGIVSRASSAQDTQTKIGGYAAKFGARSEDMGAGGIKFFEIIEPGFFDNVLGDDCRCLFNHDANLILGRTKSGTLRIRQDRTGLAYDSDLSDEQTYARDLLIAIERGDVSQSSFAFRVKPEGQRFVEQGDTVIRYLLRGGCTRLYDVSPVVYPAYPDATVALREAERALGHSIISPSVLAAQRARQLQLMEAECGGSAGIRAGTGAAARRARELQLASLQD